MAERKVTPKYVKIYWTMKEDITSGKYPPGSLLPTETELMETFGASRTTIRNAVRRLTQETLAETRQGQGTIVLGKERKEIPAEMLTPHSAPRVGTRYAIPGKVTTEGASIDLISADERLAAALGVRKGDGLYRLQCLRYLDGEPLSLMTSYLPEEMVPGLERHDESLFDLSSVLEKDYGLRLEGVEDSISAESADYITARLLKVPVRTAVLALRRTGYSGSAALEYTEILTKGSALSFVVANDRVCT